MPDRLVDRFNRSVDYVRISVTDRCDFRCVYCMAEDMTFLPRAEILTFEEIQLVARAFIELGVSKIRFTGGEPLVRNGIESLIEGVRAFDPEVELNMTTNGSQLPRLATSLKHAGLNRLNISLDSLNPDKFKQLTRTGSLDQVLQGIDSAIDAGFRRIKLNAVILKGRNDDEILPLVEFARSKDLDISFIEEMPLGEIDEHDRLESFMDSDAVRRIIESKYPLIPITTDKKIAGPSRYWSFDDGHMSRVGFISPHSHNFCDTCNRVRITAKGRLLLCLGNEHSVDLLPILRGHPGDIEPVKQTIMDAMQLKPERHYFNLAQEVKILRFMNTTGG